MKSFKELVDLAKANPGKMPYGTFGNATTSHLYGELLKKNAGIDMTHVPYRGAAPLLNDLLNNTVTAAFLDLTTAGAQIARRQDPGAGGRRRKAPDATARRADHGRTWSSRALKPKAGLACSCRPRRPRIS